MKSLDHDKMLTEAQERLYNIIPYGKDQAISRERLVQLLGRCDRMIRYDIKELRMNGVVICSDTQHKGYWKPTKRSEVEDFIMQMESYGKQCFNASKSAREYMKNHEDQLHV